MPDVESIVCIRLKIQAVFLDWVRVHTVLYMLLIHAKITVLYKCHMFIGSHSYSNTEYRLGAKHMSDVWYRSIVSPL